MTGSGQHKRITYLARRADLTPEQFSLHWSTVHADIARDFERLDAYFQNHVVASVTVVGEASPFEIDGIVELWFEDEEAAGAGFSSTLADRLKEDERRFLSGLSGSSVSSRGPTPAQPHKVWLVASTEPDANPWEVARDMVRAFVPSGAGSRAINLAHAPARLLSREGLQQLTPLRSIAISWGFRDPEKARAAFDDLRDAPALFASLASARLLLAEEVRVVDNSHEPFPTGPSDATTHWGALEDQLLAFTDRHHELLIAALDGPNEEEVRLRLVPSKTTILGLVKHAAYAEQVWFGEALTGVPRPSWGCLPRWTHRSTCPNRTRSPPWSPTTAG